MAHGGNYQVIHSVLPLKDEKVNSPLTPATHPGLSFAGREGLISREEITAYFMRASSIYSKLGLGFPHNFQETTYLKPTFCDNCAGFVSCPWSASGLNLGRGTRQVK